jgi:manganese/zinc/iron transport system permease protein
MTAAFGGPLFAATPTSDMWTSLLRFWSFSDPSVRTATLAMICLGVVCGSLGSLVVLRRESLLGDSLGHAVLPGICVGFLVTQTKHAGWIFAGALGSALLASGLISVLPRLTRLKPDAVMGLVLSAFFGFGALLLSRLQKLPSGSQSGLNQVLFGQAAAISESDLTWIAVSAAVIVAVLLIGFKEWTLVSFDPGFAVGLGRPVAAMQMGLALMLAVAVVISVQAVGVVLLSALLVTPAATARLLTRRMWTMLLTAVVIACGSGTLGLNLSYLDPRLPTGPFVVLVAAVVFAVVWLFAPGTGFVWSIASPTTASREPVRSGSKVGG